MMAIAVSTIEIPISIRRNNCEVMAWRTGECGNSYSAPNTQAETMNAPSRPASIRYSGQCARKDANAPSLGGCSKDAAAGGVGIVARFCAFATRFCAVQFMESVRYDSNLWRE